MTVHLLKTLPEYFDALASQHKSFEIRYDDRRYAVDDILGLREWTGDHQDWKQDDPDPQDPDGRYTGRVLWRRVTYRTDYQQTPGYVVLAVVPCDPPSTDLRDVPRRDAASWRRDPWATVWDVLDAIVAEWSSDPVSVQCFDLRLVDRATALVAQRKRRLEGRPGTDDVGDPSWTKRELQIIDRIVGVREYCPGCGAGPRIETDRVVCPRCGRRWEGPPLATHLR